MRGAGSPGLVNSARASAAEAFGFELAAAMSEPSGIAAHKSSAAIPAQHLNESTGLN